MNRQMHTLAAAACLASLTLCSTAIGSSYPVIDTAQEDHYNTTAEICAPIEGDDFYGQDAGYFGAPPRLVVLGDGTISDQVTGLMWQQDPGEKMTYAEAAAGAGSFDLGGYQDWRLPTIKELYSLMCFDGTDPSGYEGSDTDFLTPFIDTDYFVFEYGDPNQGERIIDSQFISSTEFLGQGMAPDMVFGVNFADGRIKGYPSGPMPHEPDGKLFFVLYVRSATNYGVNQFQDNGDGTITDLSTGLEWMKVDSGSFHIGPASDGAVDWPAALEWAESLELAGHSDWRLPNAKELQSIVDYTHAPTFDGLPAIDPIFEISTIVDESGSDNFPFYWTGTTHANWVGGGQYAAYITFGSALGYWQGEWVDVHGAGAQRSDPKVGDPDDYPFGHGPQGDAVRIYNHVRCVRGGLAQTPMPDVKINGQDRGVQVPAGETVQVSVELDAEDFKDVRSDLWVVAETPRGSSSYVYPSGWTAGLERALEMPLRSLEAIELLASPLPNGEYQIHFAVDHDDDGELDATFTDSVDLIVGLTRREGHPVEASSELR